MTEPASHSSPESRIPSPQNENLQLVLHELGIKSLLKTPLSHSSPASTLPFPQSLLHLESHLGPPSHSSPSWSSTIPSPQVGNLQVVLQALGAVLEFSLPLSHCSVESTTLSPHDGLWQLERQASHLVSEFNAPLSHCSFPSTIPFPHSSLQSLLQPSPSTLFPSSHCSKRASSITPSPQAGRLQLGLHLFGKRALSGPWSQNSFESMTPSPHEGSLQLVLHLLGILSEFMAPLSHCSRTMLPSGRNWASSLIPFPQPQLDVDGSLSRICCKKAFLALPVVNKTDSTADLCTAVF